MKLSKFRPRLLAAVVIGGVAAAGLVFAIQVNAIVDYINIGTPATPGAGVVRVYSDSTQKVLYDVNQSGTKHHMVSTSSCSGGTPVVGNVNDDGSVTCAASGGGGGFIATLTPPSSGSFTQQNYNTGSGVVTTQTNNSSPVTSISILQHDPNGTSAIAALDKSVIASTFTVTIGFTLASGRLNALGGLYLSDGGAGPVNLIMSMMTNNGLRIPAFSNLSGSFAGDIISSVTDMPQSTGMHWFRIQETVSARIYFTSSDGINFAQVFSESNTAHFTTARYGIALENRASITTQPDCIITLWSFKETNP